MKTIKKTIILIMFMVLSLSICTGISYAGTEWVRIESPWIYTIGENNTVIIAGYMGGKTADGELWVPWTLAGMEVKKIGTGAISEPGIGMIYIPANEVSYASSSFPEGTEIREYEIGSAPTGRQLLDEEENPPEKEPQMPEEPKEHRTEPEGPGKQQQEEDPKEHKTEQEGPVKEQPEEDPKEHKTEPENPEKQQQEDTGEDKESPKDQGGQEPPSGNGSEAEKIIIDPDMIEIEGKDIINPDQSDAKPTISEDSQVSRPVNEIVVEAPGTGMELKKKETGHIKIGTAEEFVASPFEDEMILERDNREENISDFVPYKMIVNRDAEPGIDDKKQDTGKGYTVIIADNKTSDKKDESKEDTVETATVVRKTDIVSEEIIKELTDTEISENTSSKGHAGLIIVIIISVVIIAIVYKLVFRHIYKIGSGEDEDS